MDDLLAPGGLQRGADVERDRDRLGLGHRAKGVQLIGQRSAVGVLADQVELARLRILLQLIDGDDVGVLELGLYARLVVELGPLGVELLLGWQRLLHGDHPPQVVLRGVDQAACALADRLDIGEPPSLDHTAGREWHRDASA